jgi:hypothetical protein
LPEFATHLKFSTGGLPPLHWNSETYLNSVSSALSSLALPSDWGLREAWSQQCTQCMEFVNSLDVGRGNKQTTIPLLSR